MIHLFEEDPRYYSDRTFQDNHGSFSVINYGINNGLKELGLYSEPDLAKYIGFASSLNFHQQYKDKQSFYITVWETINKLTDFHIQMLKGTVS